MSTTSPSKRNLLPARVNSKILTKILPICSKTNCTKGTFKTPIAMTNCNTRPIPTVFQLMAFLFELNKKANSKRTSIPKMPLPRLLRLNPSLISMSITLLAETSSTKVVSVAFSNGMVTSTS